MPRQSLSKTHAAVLKRAWRAKRTAAQKQKERTAQQARLSQLPSPVRKERQRRWDSNRPKKAKVSVTQTKAPSNCLIAPAIDSRSPPAPQFYCNVEDSCADEWPTDSRPPGPDPLRTSGPPSPVLPTASLSTHQYPQSTFPPPTSWVNHPAVCRDFPLSPCIPQATSPAANNWPAILREIHKYASLEKDPPIQHPSSPKHIPFSLKLKPMFLECWKIYPNSSLSPITKPSPDCNMWRSKALPTSFDTCSFNRLPRRSFRQATFSPLPPIPLPPIVKPTNQSADELVLPVPPNPPPSKPDTVWDKKLPARSRRATRKMLRKTAPTMDWVIDEVISCRVRNGQEEFYTSFCGLNKKYWVPRDNFLSSCKPDLERARKDMADQRTSCSKTL